MGKYEPLAQFLSSTAEQEVPLSFSEVERTLGARLPPSAFQYREWWANENSHSQSKAWMQAGWQVWSVDLGGERVVFKRTGQGGRGVGRPAGGPGPSSAPTTIAISLDRLSAAAQKLIDDHLREHGGDRSTAVVALLNAAGANRIDRLFGWFAENGSKFDSVSSADLIREGRDDRDDG